jgi:D-xylose 1-dehydrogenase (NADP+, D-xylono-1,5-lactone-forming)
VDPVRIGVVGAANIGRRVVIPSILRARNAELVALASSSDAGERFLRETELATGDGRPLRDAVRLHQSYADLLADPDVDAVYIPLPNHLHAEWSTRAADAGKHVLCEKPAALDAAQTAGMIDGCTSRGVVWMEAFMYRFHPQWRVVRRLLDDGAIGELRAVVAVFTFTVRDPLNVRRVPKYGGGSLYDVGSYCINVSRWMFGRPPVSVSGSATRSPEGVDEEFRGVLDFGGGGSALILSSLSQPYRHHVRMLGTEGDITIPSAFVVRPDDAVTVIHTDADGRAEEHAVEPEDEYRLEVEDFADCVLAGRPPEVVSHADTLANMRTIDALYASAAAGTDVALEPEG